MSLIAVRGRGGLYGVLDAGCAHWEPLADEPYALAARRAILFDQPDG